MTSTPLPNDEFFALFDAALPIEDLVAWILAEFPAASEHEVKRLLTLIYGADYSIAPAASEERSYRVGGGEWCAFPQRVEAPR